MDRAVVFVDGNNWYHGLKRALIDPTGIDLIKVAKKVTRTRDLRGIRYYVGQVPDRGNRRLYSDQQRYLAGLQSGDGRVTVHLGRIEERREKNKAAEALLRYLGALEVRIDRKVYQDLVEIGNKHRETTFMVEKSVDVKLGIDLVVMAERDGFDTAYLFAADGDYTPAARAVRDLGKKVFAVSAGHGAELAAVLNSFIHIDAGWLKGCAIG